MHKLLLRLRWLLAISCLLLLLLLRLSSHTGGGWLSSIRNPNYKILASAYEHAVHVRELDSCDCCRVEVHKFHLGRLRYSACWCSVFRQSLQIPYVDFLFRVLTSADQVSRIRTEARLQYLASAKIINRFVYLTQHLSVKGLNQRNLIVSGAEHEEMAVR